MPRRRRWRGAISSSVPTPTTPIEPINQISPNTPLPNVPSLKRDVARLSIILTLIFSLLGLATWVNTSSTLVAQAGDVLYRALGF